jgi:hypothetical protein
MIIGVVANDPVRSFLQPVQIAHACVIEPPKFPGFTDESGRYASNGPFGPNNNLETSKLTNKKRSFTDIKNRSKL